MDFIHHPIFREILLILAIVVLIIFCIDKSRQNLRTRQALYNCIYPLYATAVFKTVMLVDTAIGFNIESHIVGFVVALLATFAYWRLFPARDDINYNKIFRYIGWLVIAICVFMQATFVVWTLRH